MTQRSFRFALPLSLVLAAATALPVHAEDAPKAAAKTVDVLELADGTKLEGTVVGQDENYVTFRSAGVTRAYARARIATLSTGPASKVAPKDGQADAGKLADGKKPVAGKAKKKAEDKAKKKADRKLAKRPPVAPPTAVLNEASQAWLSHLVTRAGATDPSVRRSVASAMIALGPAALAPVKEAAQEAEGSSRKLLESVARGLHAQHVRNETRRKKAVQDRAKNRKKAAKMREQARRKQGEAAFQRFMKDLELGEDQKQPMRDLLKRATQKRNEVTSKARAEGTDVYSVDQQMQALRTSVNAAAAKILDEGQRVLFEEHSARLLRTPMPKKKKMKKTDAPTKKPAPAKD